ncbi:MULTISPECIES: PBP1A family penicillin-binding protein [Enterococcus]|uniref:Penicillin-binding protein n=1 Tax=Enterococcus sulfureus ATCC 49903 TaxID=1140003 RepID=S0PBJ8_9ENTE|nr:PBP1A family penicillin-binding protein [Enterococcus sulfureus]EOT48763.1 penicillin-binding protein [Enterococcus sulfureus ATCC 49903]EOT87655.1 penicillin-binding protein [Enterococcus sulfureus ATCC 49903]
MEFKEWMIKLWRWLKEAAIISYQWIKKASSKSWKFSKPYLIRFHHFRKRIWKKYHINKVLILLGMIAILCTSVYLFYVAKTTNVSELESGLKESTMIYDNKGESAGKLYEQKGAYIQLTEMSPYLVDGVISTEDRNFYTHHGFDIKGIGRAAMRFVINRGASGGGGSTITQQLAKNAYLTLDQTFTRKAKEIFLAIEIEKHYSKDEILTMYLNTSYFGNGVWGVQDASEKYFGVNASELSPGEAATLIGMLKGPSLYNPIDNLENATNRRDTVLQLMAENQKISPEVAKEQAAIPLDSLLSDTYQASNDSYRYPSYFDAVIDEAVDQYGLDADDILNRGYKIYTTLDQNQQQAMQDTYTVDGYFPDNAEDGEMVQSASVAVSPKDGGVTALVGRRGESVFRGYNFATQMRRSPGSTIKPLAVYTPALEAGYTPASTLKDEPLSYYKASNYSQTYSGEVPMYQAVAQSLNLPAVWLLHEIGLDKGFDKAKEFGLSLSDEDKYWGLALGGLKYGESPLTMAAAYSVFANGGTYYKPHLITKIVDSTGAVIVDNSSVKGKRIISEKVATAMTSILLGTFSNGTGVLADPAGYTVAGKTGTTETNFDASKVNDQWVIGYTPDLVIATWLGFERSSESHYLQGTSETVAGLIFQKVAENILPYTSGSTFDVADAYQTDGVVMSINEAEAKAKEDAKSSWQKGVDEITEKTKEGLQTAGEAIKDTTEKVWNGVLDKLWR